MNDSAPITVQVTGMAWDAAPETPREALWQAGVLTLSLTGGPGCGKTSIIEETAQRLPRLIRPAVICSDVPCAEAAGERNPRWGARHDGRVVTVYTGVPGPVRAGSVRAALALLDPEALDVLFIESRAAAARCGSPAADLGGDLKAAVLSVATADGPDEYRALVRGADVVLLNKVDLPSRLTRDPEALRDEVLRANPAARVFEVSARDGRGMDAWAEWLRGQYAERRSHVSHWFG